jgi:hypothetical protein
MGNVWTFVSFIGNPGHHTVLTLGINECAVFKPIATHRAHVRPEPKPRKARKSSAQDARKA